MSAGALLVRGRELPAAELTRTHPGDTAAALEALNQTRDW